MSQLFAWGGQSTGVSALASFLPKNTQCWSPLAVASIHPSVHPWSAEWPLWNWGNIRDSGGQLCQDTSDNKGIEQTVTGSVASLKVPISWCLEPDPCMTRALGNVSVLRWRDPAGLSWGTWSNHSLEEQRGFPSCGQRDRQEDTNRQEECESWKGNTDWLWRQRKGPRAKACGERRHGGGRSRRLRKWPATLDLAQWGSCLLASRAADKASAVLKPWYLVLCSGSRMGSRCGQWGQRVQTQWGAGPLDVSMVMASSPVSPSVPYGMMLAQATFPCTAHCPQPRRGALASRLELLEREWELSACLWEASLQKPWGPVITANLEAQGNMWLAGLWAGITGPQTVADFSH